MFRYAALRLVTRVYAARRDTLGCAVEARYRARDPRAQCGRVRSGTILEKTARAPFAAVRPRLIDRGACFPTMPRCSIFPPRERFAWDAAPNRAGLTGSP